MSHTQAGRHSGSNHVTKRRSLTQDAEVLFVPVMPSCCSWMFWKNMQICLIFLVPFSSFRWRISHCGMQQISEFGFGHTESYLAHHLSQTAISNARRLVIPSGGEVLIGWENGWTGMGLWDEEGDIQSANRSDKQVWTHTHTSGYTSDCANTGRKYKRITNKDAWACTYELSILEQLCVGGLWTSEHLLLLFDKQIRLCKGGSRWHTNTLKPPFNGCLSALVGGYYHQLWVFSNLRCCERLLNFHLFFHIFTEDFSSSFYFEEIGSNSHSSVKQSKT